MPRFPVAKSLLATSLFATSLFVAVFATVELAPRFAAAQEQQVPLPPGGFKPPPAAPVKPYKPVPVTGPTADSDPAFIAFRKQLADVVKRKDRAALAKLVVAHEFFWIQDKDLAEANKSGVDNLAKAIDLDAKDGSGWDILSGYAEEETAGALPDHQGVVCAPAGPGIDPKAFQALLESTQTDPSEWGYPIQDNLDVRSAGQPQAPVIDKLGMSLVRVLPDSAPPDNANQPPFLHVATPSGKAGFVPADSISGLGSDQMCYVKDGGGWKITGYFGGAGE
jgi:hypothetical protein